MLGIEDNQSMRATQGERSLKKATTYATWSLSIAGSVGPSPQKVKCNILDEMNTHL